MMPTKVWREESRKDWYDATRVKPDLDQLTFGALQRIADATETMAQDHERLTRQNKWLKQSIAEARREADCLRRRLAATQGVVTRMKRQREKR